MTTNRKMGNPPREQMNNIICAANRVMRNTSEPVSHYGNQIANGII